MLTDPAFAGRICQRKVIHEDLHPAIFDPEVWESVQAKLKAETVKVRGRDTAASPCCSQLVGKLFDDGGDRLTPSHGKTRNRIRHRFHVSHRLIARSDERDLTGGRLDTQMLEDLIVRIALRHRCGAAFPAAAIIDTTASGLIGSHGRVVERVGDDVGQEAMARSVADRIARIDLAPGRIGVRVSFDRASCRTASSRTSAPSIWK